MSDFALLERLGHLVPVEGGATILGKHRRKAWYVVRDNREEGHQVTQAPRTPVTPEHSGVREVAPRENAERTSGDPAAKVEAGAAPCDAAAEEPQGEDDGWTHHVIGAARR
jgi:hypothetical protein